MEIKIYKGRPISLFVEEFYLILHSPTTAVEQPTIYTRNIEVESNDDSHFESFDALGPGRRILKILCFTSLTVKR